jgi:hypothetical protein
LKNPTKSTTSSKRSCTPSVTASKPWPRPKNAGSRARPPSPTASAAPFDVSTHQTQLLAPAPLLARAPNLAVMSQPVMHPHRQAYCLPQLRSRLPVCRWAGYSRPNGTQGGHATRRRYRKSLNVRAW